MREVRYRIRITMRPRGGCRHPGPPPSKKYRIILDTRKTDSRPLRIGLKEKNNISNVLFSDYRVGSLYAFHSGNLDIDVFMKDRGTQFDLWRKERRFNHSFERSIIMVDNQFPVNRRIEELFKNIRFLKNMEIKEGSLIIFSISF